MPVHAPHQRRGQIPQFLGQCLFAFSVIPRSTVRAALTPFGPSRPRPRRPSAQRTGSGLCRGLGACSLPALAPPKPVTPPAPDRLRGQPPLRSGSLVTGRLTGGFPHQGQYALDRHLPLDPAPCKTPSNQGRLNTHAQTSVRNPPPSPARTSGKGYKYSPRRQRLTPLRVGIW